MGDQLSVKLTYHRSRWFVFEPDGAPRPGGYTASLPGAPWTEGAGATPEAALASLAASLREWVEGWDAARDEYSHRPASDIEPTLAQTIRRFLRAGVLEAELAACAGEVTLDPRDEPRALNLDSYPTRYNRVGMDPAPALRDARRRAGLTQSALAELVGTSQATISAYENSSKQPAVATLARLLAATGSRLAVVEGRPPVIEPSEAELERAGRRLAEVLELAEALPVRHSRTLRFPRLGDPR